MTDAQSIDEDAVVTKSTASPRLLLVLLGLVVLLANSPYLVGWFDPNPLLQFGGLSTATQHGLLPGKSTIDPNAGFTSQALARRAVLDWFHGQVPWWNPFEGLGSPLTAEMQSAAFFPLIVLLALPNGQMWLYLLLEMIAAFGTYLLLRRLSLSPWACFAGAATFGLNGTFSWFRFAPSNPVCFLPVTILAAEIIRERVSAERRSRWYLLSIAVALSVVAGFPEVAYLDALVVVIWIAFRLPGLTRPQMRRYLSCIVLGAAVGVMLSAPVLVAFVDYLPYADVGRHSVGYIHTFLPRAGVGALVFPYLFGPIFSSVSSSAAGMELNRFWSNTGGYLTVAVVLLAALGLTGRRHRRLKFALAAWSSLLVARTYGVVPASELLNLLPGLKHVASYRYMDPGLEFSMAILAAFGVHDLLEWRVTRSRLLVTTALVATAAVLAALGGNGLVAGTHYRAWEDSSLAWGFGTLALIVVVALSRSRANLRSAIVVAILPLEALALLVVPEMSAPRSGREDIPLVSFLRDHSGLSRFVTLGPFRPNYGSYFGVASINVNDTPTPARFNQVVTGDLDPNSQGILYDGTYQVNKRSLTTSAALTRYIANYEALDVKYVLRSARVAAPMVAGRRLTPVYHDAEAAVYQLPNVTPYFVDRSPGCSLRTVSREDVTVRCREASVLQRSELWMPGWSVEVNGHPRTLSPSQLSLQLVRLGAGASQVRYRFTPRHILAGWFAALAGLLACMYSAAPLPPVRRARPRSDPDASPRRS